MRVREKHVMTINYQIECMKASNAAIDSLGEPQACCEHFGVKLNANRRLPCSRSAVKSSSDDTAACFTMCDTSPGNETQINTLIVTILLKHSLGHKSRNEKSNSKR